MTSDRGEAARPEPPDPASADSASADAASADAASADAASADAASADAASADAASTGPAGDEALADAFGAVARQLRERSAETLAPWGITPAHLRALRTLARHGTMRLSELSDRLEIAPRTATEVVDALQASDLVRRRADPGDRRATLVEVTDHGGEILAEIRGARGLEAGRVFGRLTPADRAELARILAGLRD
jgi:DNA-binding MarR family transcriptional regulator